MASDIIEKVLTVLQGIEDRNPDLATKYIHPKKYKTHNPLVADGVDGLKAYIESFPSSNNHLKTVRVFQDGSYVITQEDGDILGKNTFFEVFRFEDGWIVEHWVFSSKSAPPNQSGHTQVDGPTNANHYEDTNKNKKIIQDYYQTFHIAGDHSNIAKYFSGDVCVRHEPGVKDGVTAFMQDVEAAASHRSIDTIKLILAQGDFVFILAEGSLEGNACVYVDLYRVEDEKIVEHWGFIEKTSSTSGTKNNSGVI